MRILGMRTRCQILIYIDLPKALDAGLKFFISQNGVVLSPGNDKGYIQPEFFLRVESQSPKGRTALEGFKGPVSGVDAVKNDEVASRSESTET